MRFLVLVKPNSHRSDYEAGALPDEADLEAMGRFNEEMFKAGIILAMDGLQPPSKGARIRFGAGKEPSIVDGPFTEAKELVGGFWILQAKSKDDVVAWMRRAPFKEGDELEIRQIFEPEDFESVVTPEHKERMQRVREQLAQEV